MIPEGAIRECTECSHVTCKHIAAFEEGIRVRLAEVQGALNDIANIVARHVARAEVTEDSPHGHGDLKNALERVKPFIYED